MSGKYPVSVFVLIQPPKGTLQTNEENPAVRMDEPKTPAAVSSPLKRKPPMSSEDSGDAAKSKMRKKKHKKHKKRTNDGN